MTWENVPLGKVVRVDAVQVSPDSVEPGTTYVGLEHISVGGVINETFLAAHAGMKSNKNRFTSRHILYGKLRPNLGKVARPRTVGVCSTDIYPLLPGPEIDRDYLAQFLLSPQAIAYASSRTAGVNLPRVSWSALGSLSVPLPPLPEQRRIAAILDEADQLRFACQEAVAHTSLAHRDFARSSIEESIKRDPHGLLRLGDLVRFSSGRFLPNKSQRPGDVIVYGGNGPNGWHDEAMFESPQLIVGRVGALCGAVHVTRGPTWVTDNALIASWDRGVISIEHLAWQLRLANLNQFAAVSGQPSISAARIADVKIVVPSAVQSERFAEAEAAHQDQIDRASRREKRMESLFASLQHRAFRGEL